MSKKHNKAKKPRATTKPTVDKIPRAIITTTDNDCPDFRTAQMDNNELCNWNNLPFLNLQDLLQKLFESQRLTWQELRKKGSHPIDITALIADAQKRLCEIKKDDLDQLYSLRLTGKNRVWGIKEGNILWLLWWDPSHSICPSLKKHT
jgi:hypothetical protein